MACCQASPPAWGAGRNCRWIGPLRSLRPPCRNAQGVVLGYPITPRWGRGTWLPLQRAGGRGGHVRRSGFSPYLRAERSRKRLACRLLRQPSAEELQHGSRPPLPLQPDGTLRRLPAGGVAPRPRCARLHRLLSTSCPQGESQASQPAWVLRWLLWAFRRSEEPDKLLWKSADPKHEAGLAVRDWRLRYSSPVVGPYALRPAAGYARIEEGTCGPRPVD